jgi:hypothetical protein
MTPATLEAHIVLELEDVFQRAVKTVGPKMRAGGRVDQLPGNADPIAALAHRAFEHIAHAEIAPDLLHIDGLALVREARIAGDDEQPADAGERGDDLLHHAVDEIFLLRIAAHIGEGQHRDRRFVGEGEGRRAALTHLPPLALGSLSCNAGEGGRWRVSDGVGEGSADPVCPDGPRDILERLLAHVFEGEVEAARRILLDAGRDADAARLGQAFEPRRHVHTVSEDVAILDDDVANVDADAELDATVQRQRGVAFGHCRLHHGCTTQRVDDAGEFDQHSVAGRLDDAASMARDLRIDHLGAQQLEPAERAFLVGFDQARVAGDISREDRREPTFDASWPCGLHGASSVATNPTPTGAPRALSMRPLKHEATPIGTPSSGQDQRVPCAAGLGLIRAIGPFPVISRLAVLLPGFGRRNSRFPSTASRA